MYLFVCSDLTYQECVTLCTRSYTLYKTPQTAVTFLLEAGGTSLVAIWRKVCVEGEWQEVGRTMLWIVTPFPRGLCNNSSKRSHLAAWLSRWHGEGGDDLARGHRSWFGWFVESWWMQGCRCLLIGWLWCTGGLWVDGYVRGLNPTPS